MWTLNTRDRVLVINTEARGADYLPDKQLDLRQSLDRGSPMAAGAHPTRQLPLSSA